MGRGVAGDFSPADGLAVGTGVILGVGLAGSSRICGLGLASAGGGDFGGVFFFLPHPPQPPKRLNDRTTAVKGMRFQENRRFKIASPLPEMRLISKPGACWGTAKSILLSRLGGGLETNLLFKAVFLQFVVLLGLEGLRELFFDLV